MGRWWIFNYADDNNTIMQGRIHAYTGDIIEVSSSISACQGQYQGGSGMLRGGAYSGTGCYRY